MATNQAHFLRTGLRKLEVGDTPTDCTICLEEGQLGQELHQIRACGHAFHEHCLLFWLNSNNTQHSSCPVCRQELYPTGFSRDAGYLNQILPSYLADSFVLEATLPNDNEHTHLPLVSKRRQSHTVAPDTSRCLTRGIRAQDGTDPAPACLLPDPVTGKYTTIETRYRAYWQQDLVRAGGMDDNEMQEFVDRLWGLRSNFVRDLERLEHIHLRLVPSSVTSNVSVCDTQHYIEYGSLLERLMPNDVSLDINTSQIIIGIDDDLQIDARRFSLLSITEEERYRRSAEQSWGIMAAVYTVERRRSLVEDLMQRHRLSQFVDSEAYRHYLDAPNGPFGRPPSPRPVRNQRADMVGDEARVGGQVTRSRWLSDVDGGW